MMTWEWLHTFASVPDWALWLGMVVFGGAWFSLWGWIFERWNRRSNVAR